MGGPLVPVVKKAYKKKEISKAYEIVGSVGLFRFFQKVQRAQIVNVRED